MVSRSLSGAPLKTGPGSRPGRNSAAARRRRRSILTSMIASPPRACKRALGERDPSDEEAGSNPSSSNPSWSTQGGEREAPPPVAPHLPSAILAVLAAVSLLLRHDGPRPRPDRARRCPGAASSKAEPNRRGLPSCGPTARSCAAHRERADPPGRPAEVSGSPRISSRAASSRRASRCCGVDPATTEVER